MSEVPPTYPDRFPFLELIKSAKCLPAFTGQMPEQKLDDLVGIVDERLLADQREKDKRALASTTKGFRQIAHIVVDMMKTVRERQEEKDEFIRHAKEGTGEIFVSPAAFPDTEPGPAIV